MAAAAAAHSNRQFDGRVAFGVAGDGTILVNRQAAADYYAEDTYYAYDYDVSGLGAGDPYDYDDAYSALGNDEKHTKAKTTAASATAKHKEHPYDSDEKHSSPATNASDAETKCLCIFDIDCTLSTSGGGGVKNSEMYEKVKDSFCAKCNGGKYGVITAGDAGRIKAGGDVMKSVHAGEGGKQVEAAKMAKEAGVDEKNVYFFDDKALNVDGFKKTKMNAIQIACDGKKCGGTLKETRKETGVKHCR